MSHVATGRVVFTTFAEFNEPNDVKVGAFSSDSSLFAAAYHYGHDGGYAWIGYWSTFSGQLVSLKKTPVQLYSLAGEV